MFQCFSLLSNKAVCGYTNHINIANISVNTLFKINRLSNQLNFFVSFKIANQVSNLSLYILV